jgi:hypothetical protein
MLRELVTRSPLLVLPLLVLFTFLGVFVVALVRTYARRASTYDPIAELPLEEEDR